MHFSHQRYSAIRHSEVDYDEKFYHAKRLCGRMVDSASAGLLLVFAGVAIIIVGLLLTSRSEGGGVKGAGVVLVGPVPIIFGSDAKWASIAIALAIILIFLVAVLYLA
jgi:uncharacterized protein (TIGR00304 family)